MKRMTRVLISLVTLALVAGCSGGSGSSNGGSGGKDGGQLRFINTIPELSQVQVYLNDDTEPLLLNFDDLSEYQGFSSVEVRMLVASSPLPLIKENVKVKGDQTMVFFGDPNPKPTKYTPTAKIFDDKHDSKSDNRFLLRVIDAAVSTDPLPALKIFVTKPGVSLDNILPVKEGLSFGSDTGYIEGNESPAIVTVLYEKTKNKVTTRTVIYQSEPIDFATTPVMSIVLSDQVGGGGPIRAIYSPDSEF